ncbi:MAG: hypothetical protein ACTSUV_00280 [Candidatus Ranarchaeia archaeon]
MGRNCWKTKKRVKNKPKRNIESVINTFIISLIGLGYLMPTYGAPLGLLSMIPLSFLLTAPAHYWRKYKKNRNKISDIQ